MNTKKWAATLHAIRKEFEQSSILDSLATFRTTLQQVAQTQNPEPVRTQWQNLRTLLENAQSNNFPPTGRLIISEANSADLMGVGLMKSIEAILSASQYLPSQAANEIQKLSDRVSIFYEAVKTATDSLDSLNVQAEEVPEGEFELGVLFPKHAFGPELEAMHKELKDLDRAIQAVQEIVGDGHGSPTVRQISSSDWTFYLALSVATVKGLLWLMEKVLDLRKKHLENKILQQQIDQTDLSDALKQQFHEELDTKLNGKIKEIGHEFVECYFDGDSGRKNELLVSAAISVRYLASRIDKGVVFEILPPTRIENKIDPGTIAAEGTSQVEDQLQIAIEFNRLASEQNQIHSDVLRLSLLSPEENDK